MASSVTSVANFLPAMGTGDLQPKNAKEAAGQFEALLLAQMLKSMHEAGEGGWLGTGEDQAGSSMMEMAEEHLAQVLASQGGLGLARMVAQGLDQNRTKPSAIEKP
jgi:Rod binding domain-containing protein